MDWEYERKAKWKMRKVEPKFKRKNTVARAKAIALDETYKELEEKGEERKALRIAKAQDKATKDYTQIRQIKDGEGMVLNEEEKIRDRWKSYFKSLLNEENPRAGFEDGALNLGVTCAMSAKAKALEMHVKEGSARKICLDHPGHVRRNKNSGENQ
ncbi:uncharacterized protein [Penaeus vannamei]|uniref:uncharacterized protein n=1 Tax=Penaeus vannamei TaxID=6689 RepID=UPI00387F3886